MSEFCGDSTQVSFSLVISFPGGPGRADELIILSQNAMQHDVCGLSIFGAKTKTTTHKKKKNEKE